METEVVLQPPFAFDWWVMAVGIVLAVVAAAIPALAYLARTRSLASNPPELTAVKMEAPMDPESLRARYLRKLDDVERDFASGDVPIRDAYQALSAMLRNFVYDVGGPDMRNSTLADLAGADMPQIYELVKDYYEPEFALRSQANLEQSISATREVIRSWR